MSMPALAGYHPNRFQPMPRNPVPSPCSLMALLPLTPTPAALATLLHPTLGSAQASHPCAPLPAPSPSQTTSRPPVATGPAGAPFIAGAAFVAPAAVTGAAPPAPGQGGQRQPAVPTARTASQPRTVNRGARNVITA